MTLLHNAFRVDLLPNVKQREAMENEQKNNEKITRTSIRLEPEIDEVVAELVAEDRRPSKANMMEWLISTHPRVTKRLRAETVTV